MMEGGQLHPHVSPELCIQVGQRLIHQKRLGPAHNGAANRDPLLLPARKLAGAAVQQMGDVQHLGRLLHLPTDLGFGDLAHREGKRHIFIHGHLGIEGVILEHHRQIPLAGFKIVAQLVSDPELAAGDVLQPGDHAQRGGLSAAGGPHKNNEFAVPYPERKIPHRILILFKLFAHVF